MLEWTAILKRTHFHERKTYLSYLRNGTLTRLRKENPSTSHQIKIAEENRLQQATRSNNAAASTTDILWKRLLQILHRQPSPRQSRRIGTIGWYVLYLPRNSPGHWSHSTIVHYKIECRIVPGRNKHRDSGKTSMRSSLWRRMPSKLAADVLRGNFAMPLVSRTCETTPHGDCGSGTFKNDGPPTQLLDCGSASDS